VIAIHENEFFTLVSRADKQFIELACKKFLKEKKWYLFHF